MSSNTIKTDKEDVSEVKVERFNYRWRIKNFKHLYKQPGEYLNSPCFSFGSNDKINWYLKLHPNGNCKENEGFLTLFLYWKHNSILEGQFRMSLINEQEKKYSERKAELVKKTVNDAGIGFWQFISRREVLNEKSGLLPNDSLTIQCEIVLSLDVKQLSEVEIRVPKAIRKPNILEKLFLEEHLSDFKLIATSSGKSLPAHKNVLAACSPVFDAMFKNDMLEQRMGEVKIEDTEYEVIREMLRFIYVNEVENIESIVFDLVKLAHMYQIIGLIELCEEALYRKISIDTVLEVIAVANHYNLDDVKSSALNFARIHIKDVVKSDDFKSSMDLQAIKSVLEAVGQQ